MQQISSSGLSTWPDQTTAPREFAEVLFSYGKNHEQKQWLLGGGGSARSQFRGRINEVVQFESYNASCGVRVDSGPLALSGAVVPTAAKHRGTNASSFSEATFSRDRIKKRSLKRALRRSARDGGAWYKGRWISSQRPAPQSSASPTKVPGVDRLSIFTWNCGGLSGLLFQEIRTLLGQHPEVKILVLQETHHDYQSEWTDGGWTFIHSPAKVPKQGGIMVGIRSDFSLQSTIRWQELIPGRLVHVRCYAQEQHLDVVGIYQHTLPFGGSSLEAALKKRKTLWNRLDGFLKSLPVRSSVFLAGDFNSGVNPSSPLAGPGVLPHSQQKLVVEERQWLTEMLRSHQLCALNTWGTRRATYQHPTGQSQIDFILVRCALADGESRRCGPWRVPLAGWRTAGHLPLLASVRVQWRPWLLKKPTRGGGAAAVYPDESVPLGRLRADVLRCSEPAAAPPARPGVEGLDGRIVQFWNARRQLQRHQQVKAASFRQIFARLRLVLQLQKRHRELRARARANKRKQLLSILSIAESAAQQGDSRSLFRCVRWLAPRSATRSIRLRDAAGYCLMHPRDECKMLADYAKKLFQAQRPEDRIELRLLPLPPALFHEGAWRKALLQLKPGKVAPVNEPGVQAWRDLVDEVAPRLQSIAEDSLCAARPTIPAKWTEMQLAWLPKVGKTPSTPENLRSIGLLPADTKALMLILRDAAADSILASIRSIPQYAYRPGSSTGDAILRASSHCGQVRALLREHQQDHTSKILGTARVPLVGGLMVSVDLRKAFDSVSHQEIYHSLLEADVDEAIAVAPVQMHVQSTCTIQHGGTTRTVPMSRGLRQGCPIAPILFAAWTGRLMRRLRALATGQAWQRYTMFADDLHGSWLIRDVAGFRAAIAELLSLIRLLQDLGMAVNFQKSLAVLRLRGSSVPRINRSFLVWRDGAQYLRLRSEPQDIFLPLAGMMPYLGVTLSDDNFELQTFRARAGSAQARFQELRRVLRSQGPLAERHRLRLYKATVWPTLWYALAMVGVTVDVLRGVSSLLAGHLRKVLRIYKEGVSNEQVLCQADLRPAEFLLAQTRRKQASIQEDAHRSVELKAPELARVGALLELLEVSAEVPGTTTLTASLRSEVAFIPCPVCGVYYDSQGSLNMHIQHRHPHIHQEAKLAFSKERHSLFGLPHCRFCRSRLHDWRSLARHVATGTCPRLKEFAALGLDEAAMLQRITDEEARDPPAPPEGVRLPSAAQGLVDEALRVTPEQLGTHGACLRVLAQSCALCGQLVKEAGKMKTHWMRSHKEDWAQVSGVIVGEAKSLLSTFRTPCEYCGSKAKQVADHAGKCPALFQLLAVRHLRRVGHTSSGIQLAPSLKQREAPPQYQSFDLGHTALGRYFKAPPKSDEPSAKSASVSVPRRDMPPARGCAPAAGSGSGPPGLQSALSTIPDVPKMPWVQRLVLRNPQNYCYMNSAVMAVLHCFGGYDALPRGFQMLYTLCGKAVATAKSLVLASQLQIRAALRDWVFDERQHDVAEFAGVLLPGLGLGLGGWEARAPAEEGVAVYMRGQMPLLLPLGTEACELQHCLHEWHHSQGVLHAVVATGPSELLLVQLSRHRQGSKVMTPVTLGELVRVPFFGHGLEVQWRCYLVKAVIEHHGESVQAGHYRAVLRVNQRWMLTDDGVAAIGVEWDATRASCCYLLWLERAQVDVGDTSADAAPPLLGPSRPSL